MVSDNVITACWARPKAYRRHFLFIAFAFIIYG